VSRGDSDYVEKIENLIPMAVFARVVETLSFTEAAKTLGMSKSSVSRDIALLEQSVGGLLLKRTTRKITLTELGLSYYQHCFRILNELKSAELFAKEYHQESTGTLTILAPVTFGTQYVVPALNSFLKKNIHATIDLDLSDKEVEIKESAYDLVISVSQETPLHEHAQFLCSIQWGLFAAPGYLETVKPILTPKDLPTRDYILLRGVARSISLPFRKEKQKLSISVQSRFRSNNSIALIQMALSGRGIAYLPTYVARESVAAGKLVRVLPGWVMDDYKIWLLFKAKSNVTSGIKRFSDELQQRISASEPKDSH